MRKLYSNVLNLADNVVPEVDEFLATFVTCVFLFTIVQAEMVLEVFVAHEALPTHVTDKLLDARVGGDVLLTQGVTGECLVTHCTVVWLL